MVNFYFIQAATFVLFMYWRDASGWGDFAYWFARGNPFSRVPVFLMGISAALYRLGEEPADDTEAQQR
eukprot:SAG31_NODE_1694_length_7509_cov_14.080432_4_plen_68_part_00